MFLAVQSSFFIFTSCSESDEESTEYANWEARNNEYFENIYQEAVSNNKSGDASWFLLKSYSKDANTEGAHTDYIVVHVLSQNKEHNELAADESYVSPMFTDSVLVHYRGNLIPSESYSNGYQFDSSWQGDYDLTTMVPARLAVSNVIDGFSTALQKMHIGDRWCVYIPYQLGYGASSSSSKIPNYSVLKFDITLRAFSKPGTKLPVCY